MPEIGTFFRHCPSCGRRFEVRLVSKEEMSSEEIDEKMPHPALTGLPIGYAVSVPVVSTDGVPTIVGVEEFRYRYKCKHCGHEWVELRTKEISADAPKGFQSD